MEYRIEKAVMADAAGIAAVNMQSWRETYPGIMPDSILDNLKLESFVPHWDKVISAEGCLLVVRMGDKVIGFAAGGENHPSDSCETNAANACECELGAMYLLADYHGKGIGKALFNSFTAEMRASGYSSMVLWVARGNPASGFYLSMGGKEIDAKVTTVCGVGIPVIAFRYELM
ncbi:MAG TPA: GNAT family N-acetyltransferase [Candidatus Cloacimonadota bacterium]|nr:GNAT family N-acetyltransferase [Candidatus Cloacimonadota bacterium]